jgi:hypothetical protein
MSLAGYQAALVRLIEQPALAATTNGGSTRTNACLTSLERERLRAVAKVKGLHVTASLHRMNRIAPLYRWLPYTAIVLGERFLAEAQRFWREVPYRDLSFHNEAKRFAAHLTRRVTAGILCDPRLPEIVAFELALADLRSMPRGAANSTVDEGEDETRIREATRVRVVRFSCDPIALLLALAQERLPGESSRAGEHWLQIDWRGDIPRFDVVAKPG